MKYLSHEPTSDARTGTSSDEVLGVRGLRRGVLGGGSSSEDDVLGVRVYALRVCALRQLLALPTLQALRALWAL